MFSPEGGLCNNNNNHDKREHMRRYGAYTLQGITPTHGLTGCADRTMSSVGGVVRGLPRVSVCVGHNVLQGEGFGRENREPGAEMDEEEEAEEEGDFDSHSYCLIMMQSLNGSMGWWPLDGQKQVQFSSTTALKGRIQREKRRDSFIKPLPSAILCLQPNVFPIQTMTNCVQCRPHKRLCLFIGD